MAELGDLTFDEAEFKGRARLFPLPHLVLFPHVMQPLRIFEPRYRDLLAAALEGDRLITMSLLRPGWEEEYAARPPLYPTACLGRVVQHQLLEDGNYHVLLVGLRRLRLVRELPPRRAYREARVEILNDEDPPPGEAVTLKRGLIEAFRRRLSDAKTVQESVEQLVRDEISLGVLTDVVSFAIEIAPPEKIDLLAEVDVASRARRLIRHLDQLEPAARARWKGEFPPPFSAN